MRGAAFVPVVLGDTRENPRLRRATDLLPLFELHGCANGLAVAQHFHIHGVAYFAAAQRVGEIVQIVDRLIAKLYKDVAGLEPSLRRGRPRANVGKFDAVFLLPEIRDRAEIGAVSAATSTARSR